IAACDSALICVGTPSGTDGFPDFQRLFQVGERIGNALRQRDRLLDIAIRSTVLPGTAERLAEILARESRGSEGRDFRVFVNPEFLREGTAIADYHQPPFTVVGARPEDDAGPLCDLYAGLPSAVFVVPRREAELVKYACNLFHALKVVFGNEIGRLGKAAGIDTHHLIDVFCHDEKLNLSRNYLKPGYAFGGSCLPKDLRAILAFAAQQSVELPMLRSVQESNGQQVELGFRLIKNLHRRRVGLIGLAFKPATDDLRESPLVLLAEQLVAAGFELRIFDRHVALGHLIGENRSFINKHLPQAAELVTGDLDNVLDWADVLVIGNRLPEVEELLARARGNQFIVDLVRAVDRPQTRAAYHGLGWEVEPR
ncbi:MAG: nucleotide sugar dehydrogenase, partial [Pirellulales bacterium]